MQDKKLIALIVLSVLAVISLIYGITAPPKGRAKSVVAAAGQSAIVSSAPQGQGAQGAVPARRRAKRSQFKAWKRDPFESGQVAAATVKTLTLHGIIWNKTNPKAMIEDVIVVKGEMVGPNKVVDIQPTSVTLNDGAKDFELKLEK